MPILTPDQARRLIEGARVSQAPANVLLAFEQMATLDLDLSIVIGFAMFIISETAVDDCNALYDSTEQVTMIKNFMLRVISVHEQKYHADGKTH